MKFDKRSGSSERGLTEECLRRSLDDYTKHTVPALNIDEYANQVYVANLASGGL